MLLFDSKPGPSRRAAVAELASVEELCSRTNFPDCDDLSQYPFPGVSMLTVAYPALYAKKFDAIIPAGIVETEPTDTESLMHPTMFQSGRSSTVSRLKGIPAIQIVSADGTLSQYP